METNAAQGWKQFFTKVMHVVLGTLLVLACGYLGYWVIQLKADAQVALAEAKQQELMGEVQILQATIVKLQMEGDSLSQTPR